MSKIIPGTSYQKHTVIFGGIEHTWIPADNEKLATSIDLPVAKIMPPPWPTVIIIHGFTSSRIGRSYNFVEIGRELASEGIACVRFDHAGCGESTGEQTEFSLKTIHRDCLSVYNWLQNDSRFQHDNLGIIGSSMGAIGAMMLDACCLSRSIALWGPVYDLPDIVHTGAKQANIELSRMNNNLDYLSFKGIKLGQAYFDNTQLANLHTLINVADAPVLILHSKFDEVVSIKHARLFRDDCLAACRPYQIFELDDSSHDFFEEPSRSIVIETTRDWFIKHLID